MPTTRSSTARQSRAAAVSLGGLSQHMRELHDVILSRHPLAATLTEERRTAQPSPMALLQPAAMQQQDRLAARLNQEMTRSVDDLTDQLDHAGCAEGLSDRLVASFKAHSSSALTIVLRLRQSLRAPVASLSTNIKPDDLDIDEAFRALFSEWLRSQIPPIVQKAKPRPQPTATTSKKHFGATRKMHDQTSVRILEVAFARNKNPTAAERQKLAEIVGLTPRQILVAFQNRRHRRNLANTANTSVADEDDELEDEEGAAEDEEEPPVASQSCQSPSPNLYPRRRLSLDLSGSENRQWSERQRGPLSSGALSQPMSRQQSGLPASAYRSEPPPDFINFGRRGGSFEPAMAVAQAPTTPPATIYDPPSC